MCLSFYIRALWFGCVRNSCCHTVHQMLISIAHVRRAEAGNAEALELEWGTTGSQAITEGLRERRLDFVVAADCCYDDQAPVSLQWWTKSCHALSLSMLLDCAG